MIQGFICEDDGRPVSFDECLACAAQEHPCTFPYAMLAWLVKDAREPHDSISVTALTGCVRQAFLKRNRPYHERPSRRRALAFGTLLHDELARHVHAGALSELALKVTTPEGVAVTGRADLAINGNRNVLADYKTAAKVMPSKLPYGSHEVQLNLYRYMLARNESGPRMATDRLVVYYIDLSGPGKEHNGIVPFELPVWDDARAAEFLRSRARALHAALNGGALPPKIAREDAWLCRYCPVSTACG
jgi:hypothetical protein